MPQPGSKNWLHSPAWGLAVLAFINLFNYLDRYLVSALIEPLKAAGFGLNDAELGSLMFAFLAIYTVASPFFGALGDRFSRPRLIAAGVACWSVATAASGFAGGYLSLLAARASVGIGEAAYGTIAPSLLSDYYPAARRGRVMALFFCAIPVGSALGYVVGGLMNAHFGWRSAFFVAGTPGLGLAILCLWLRDPPRGSQDPGPAAPSPTAAPAPAAPSPTAAPAPAATAPASSGLASATMATYLMLMRNRPYAFTVLGYAAYTFAMGGLAYWMPAFLERIRGMPEAQATVSFGGIVVVTGFIGTFIGGWLGDFCARYSKQAYLIVSAIATVAAAPFVWFALTTASESGYFVCMVIAQLLMFTSTGPINATIVNLVFANQRASAVALEIFAIHLLGDAISPTLIGAISDASSLGQGVKIVPVAVLIAGLIWAWAAREQARTRFAPG
jgi:MFS family permease